MERIRAALTAARPAARATLARNAAAYVARLRRLDAGIRRCVAQVPVARRKLVTDHDAFGYFAHRYGIRVVGAVIPSQTTQGQPSARDVARLSAVIRREGVRAVFPESSVNPGLARAIARQTGATADRTLYGDALGPEGSRGRDVPRDGAGQRRRDGARVHGRGGRVPHPGAVTRRRSRARTVPRSSGPTAWRPGYGGRPVLRDVTFALRAGERAGVLGPNGGGKTTLFRTLLGELAPLAGTLDVPPRCGVVPQTERSRLDFPVSALDVALMGAIAGLPWWRRPGAPSAPGRGPRSRRSTSPTAPT